MPQKQEVESRLSSSGWSCPSGGNPETELSNNTTSDTHNEAVEWQEEHQADTLFEVRIVMQELVLLVSNVKHRNDQFLLMELVFWLRRPIRKTAFSPARC